MTTYYDQGGITILHGEAAHRYSPANAAPTIKALGAGPCWRCAK